MPSSNSSTPTRPKAQSIKSFPRADSQPTKEEGHVRARSRTVNASSITSVPDARDMILSPDDSAKKSSDIFDSTRLGDSVDEQQLRNEASRVQTIEQLPIEIRTFTERFLKSLSVKSHATPLNIDSISDLFQDFYIQAESHISTHIAALTTKLSRDNSPASSAFSKRTISARPSQDSLADQQMLTATEITDKRKARKKLELQRTALEEAVERSVCEKVYERIYRHRSTDDEEKDAKLRSKTAALSLVGIGLKELNVNVPEKVGIDPAVVEADISQQLATARERLQRMDGERHPLGKLQHLTAAHQSIVETLAKVFPSTSSADEVLPTLIYTLITSPPESLNVASNLHFIQLFRANAKIDGEAAYCLVNLEAAISFLETVDLSSLRSEEALQSPVKVSQTGGEDGSPRLKSLTADLPGVSDPKQAGHGGEPTSILQSPQQARPVHSRRISQLLQTQAERIEAGKDTLLSSADQAFDSINSTLENSFKFLFGRLREQEAENQRAEVIIPKTLDDARRLVNSPILEENEDQISASHASIASALHDDPLSRPNDKVMGLVAGKRQSREASVESSRSASSINRGGPLAPTSIEPRSLASGSVDAVGNFVNALNPLSRFGVAVPSFAKFGRGPSGGSGLTPTEKSPVTAGFPASRQGPVLGPAEGTDLNALESLAHIKKAKPPVERFVKVKDSKQLRVGELEELLKDYQRLAALVMDAQAE